MSPDENGRAMRFDRRFGAWAEAASGAYTFSTPQVCSRAMKFKTLPGVREAIDYGRWNEVNWYALIAVSALASYCDRVDGAAALLASGP
jgi:hypothetical protein